LYEYYIKATPTPNRHIVVLLNVLKRSVTYYGATASVNVMLSACVCVKQIGDAVGFKVCGYTLVLFTKSQTAQFVLKTNLRIPMQFGTGAHI